MKKKTSSRKISSYSKNKNLNQNVSYSYTRYVVIGVVIILILGIEGIIAKTFHNSSNVLGTTTYLADNQDSSSTDSNTASQFASPNKQEMPDQPKRNDTPEPTDVKEAQQQAERQTENIKQEINTELENNSLKSIEIEPPAEGTQSGKVILKQSYGTTKEYKATSSASTPLAQIINPNAGIVSVYIAGPNNITLNNSSYAVSTKFPIVVYPSTQTISIKTPNGIMVIKTFPAQIFQNLPAQNKLSLISSISLEEQDGIPIYQTQGTQTRKFLGLIPVSAKVQEQINAVTGQLMQSKFPWYFSLFGFSFSQT